VIVSEETAKAQMQCPLRTIALGGATNCVGSGCMMWVWRDNRVPLEGESRLGTCGLILAGHVA